MGFKADRGFKEAYGDFGGSGRGFYMERGGGGGGGLV